MKRFIILFLALAIVLALLIVVTEGTVLAGNDDPGGPPGWSIVPGWGPKGPPGSGGYGQPLANNDDPGGPPGWSIVPGQGRPGHPGPGYG